MKITVPAQIDIADIGAAFLAIEEGGIPLDPLSQEEVEKIAEMLEVMLFELNSYELNCRMASYILEGLIYFIEDVQAAQAAITLDGEKRTKLQRIVELAKKIEMLTKE